MVIRDPGSSPIDAGWLVGEKRWTVSDMRRRIECVVDGLGFAWLPEPMIADLLASGKLKRLQLREGAYRMVPLYLVFADRDKAGPGVLKLADIITDICAAKGAKVCSA
jgi:DNA-binding transcriptional LysR family regulator